jgi:hypothetical protein
MQTHSSQRERALKCNLAACTGRCAKGKITISTSFQAGSKPHATRCGSSRSSRHGNTYALGPPERSRDRGFRPMHSEVFSNSPCSLPRSALKPREKMRGKSKQTAGHTLVGLVFEASTQTAGVPGTAATWVAPTGTPAARASGCGGRTGCGCVGTVCSRSPRGPGP